MLLYLYNFLCIYGKISKQRAQFYEFFLFLIKRKEKKDHLKRCKKYIYVYDMIINIFYSLQILQFTFYLLLFVVVIRFAYSVFSAIENAMLLTNYLLVTTSSWNDFSLSAEFLIFRAPHLLNSPAYIPRIAKRIPACCLLPSI